MTPHETANPTLGVVPKGSLMLAIIAAWFALICALTWYGVFSVTTAGLPLRLVTATAVPPLLFFAAYAALPGVRAWVASLDLALVTATRPGALSAWPS